MSERRIKMSSKGQIVMPRELRERHGWAAGTTLEAVETPDGVLVRDAVPAPRTSIDALVGCIPYRGPRHSVTEMERVITAEARRRGAR